MRAIRDCEFKRTLDAKPNEVSIVKPGELVDVVEMSPLTLTDRRIFNLLLANAWDDIGKSSGHVIEKHELQRSLHKGTERLADSIKRLMSAIVEVRIVRDGRWQTRRVQLLGENTIPDGDDGLVRYDFQPGLCEIILESTVFARLHKKIMFSLSSKYSLALYEMIQKRGNLARTQEEFTLDEIRSFLGVPPGKLTSWINLKNKALVPAFREVSDLSDYVVGFEPIKGPTRQFVGLRVLWQRKSHPQLKDVARELDNTRLGRKARLQGRVEAIEDVFLPPIPALAPQTLQQAARLMPGHDIRVVEQDWRHWAATKSVPPTNPDAAFVAFCKQYKQKSS